MAALAPWPSAGVERLYSRGLYLYIQPLLTGASNLVPFAMIDLMVAVACAWLAWTWVDAVRSRPRHQAVVAGVWRTLAFGAAAWLVFLSLWGLNYRRVPIMAQPGVAMAEAEATEADVEALARGTVGELNRLHGVAHAVSWPTDRELETRLAPAFEAVQRELGVTRPARPGRPKPTLFGWYFERAAIAGMTNPFGLDVMMTPGALPFERPAILAHEWGHLAGWADEADAGLFGWRVCQLSDAQAQYSAWLDLWPRVARGLDRAKRRELVEALDDGPRADLAAIAARMAVVSPRVQRLAWQGYDHYLRSQGVAEGVRRYDQVVESLLRSRWRPHLTEGNARREVVLPASRHSGG